MSIKSMKPSGGGEAINNHAGVTIFHDGSAVPILSPTVAGATLTIPPGAVAFRVKTTGDVSLLLPNGIAPGGKATLATSDGYVNLETAGCNGNGYNWPDRIVLSAAANFMFDCVTANGGEF